MSSETIEVLEFLYDARVGFTQVSDFGIALADVLARQVAPSPAGMRFDIAFSGEINGPRIAGTIEGVDYLEMRADGRLDLNIHATITTRDAKRIAFAARGMLQPRPDSPLVRLLETATYSTSATEYAWLNQVLAWGVGEVNPAKGEVTVKVYVA